MTAPVAAPVAVAVAVPAWRKTSYSGSNPDGNCVEVAIAATCIRRFCDEAAATVRDDVELCGFCAAERDMIAVAAAGCR